MYNAYILSVLYVMFCHMEAAVGYINIILSRIQDFFIFGGGMYSVSALVSVIIIIIIVHIVTFAVGLSRKW